MTERHFKDNANSAKLLHYDKVPYQQVAQLRFRSDPPNSVEYKRSHMDNEFTAVFVGTTSKVLKRMSNDKSTGCLSRSSTPKDLLKERVSQNRSSDVPTYKGFETSITKLQ